MLGLCFAFSVMAQEPADAPPGKLRTDAELSELLGPIALYPDALIALILPASTYPSDLVLGARFIASGGDPAEAQEKSWDQSVRALTRYPDTLRWLDENLEWTTQVGEAFVQQPVEVMETIQQLRAQAKSLGNLIDTPQQRIVQEDDDIRIVPAQPDYIYEPRYDPDVIFYERPTAGPLLFFSTGFVVGSWLNYDCDWHRHRLYHGRWHSGWDYSYERSRRDQEDYYYINNNLSDAREWRPDPNRHRFQSRHFNDHSLGSSKTSVRRRSTDQVVIEAPKHHAGVAHPKAIAGAPHRDDHKKQVEESSKIIRHGDTPSKKGSDNTKMHSDDPRGRGVVRKEEPKHEEMKKHEEPKRKEEPRHEEMKKHDEPKHKDIPKREEMQRREEPKHKEVPKHEEMKKHDEPKRKEAPKHEEMKKRDEPKREPDKSSRDKGRGKKKDDDKKKD